MDPTIIQPVLGAVRAAGMYTPTFVPGAPSILDGYADEAQGSVKNRETAAWLSPQGTTNAASSIDPQQLANNSVVADAQEQMEFDQLDPVAAADLADRLNAEHPSDLTIGMVQELAQGEPVPEEVTSRQAWLNRVERAKHDAFSAYKQAEQTQRDRIDELSGGDPFTSAVLQTAHTVNSFFGSLVSPKDAVDVINIAGKYLPDFKLSDYADKAEVMTALGHAIERLPDDARKAVFEDIANEADQRAGTFTENPVVAKRIKQQLFSSVLESFGWGTNVMNALEMLAPVTALAPGIGLVKPLAQGGVGVAKGTAAVPGNVINNVVAGAQHLIVPPAGTIPPVPFRGSFVSAEEFAAERALADIPDQVMKTRADEILKQRLGHRYRGTNQFSFERNADGSATIEARIGPTPGVGYHNEGMAQDVADRLFPGSRIEQHGEGGELGWYIKYPVTIGLDDLFPTAVAEMPEMALGTTADAATFTTAGVRAALDLAQQGDGGALGARGTSPEEVVATLVFPKLDQGLNRTVDPLGKPYLDPAYFSAASAEEAERIVREGLAPTLEHRLKDTAITNITDSGFDYTMHLGQTGGVGFNSAAKADAGATEMFGMIDQLTPGNGYSIVNSQGVAATAEQLAGGAVPPGSQWFVRVGGTLNGPGVSAIRSAVDWVRPGAIVGQLFGSEVAMTMTFNRLRGLAQTRSDQALEHIFAAREPFDKLNVWKKQKVLQALDAQEASGRNWTRADAIRHGLSPEQADGFVAANRVKTLSHAMEEAMVRAELVKRGYLQLTVGNEVLYGANVSVAAGHGTTPALDLSTGATRVAQPGDTVFQFLQPSTGGLMRGVLAPNARNGIVSALPQRVLGNAPGVFPRANHWSFRVMDGDTVLYGARSAREGKATMETLRQQYIQNGLPHTNLKVERMASLQGGGSSIDPVLSAVSNNQMANKFIPPSPLTDLAGRPRITSIEAGLDELTRQFANNAGMQRFAQHVVEVANDSVRHLGVNLRVGETVVAPRSLSLVDEKLLNNAKRMMSYVETTMGMTPWQSNRFVREMQNFIADSILNTADRLKGTGLSSPVYALGENISGASNNIVRGLKSATFYTMLGTNMFRNPVLQTSMIPTYMGVNGMFKYAMSGGYALDFTGLGSALLTDGKLMTARTQPLYDLWKATGLTGSIKGHVLTLNTIAETRVGPTSVFKSGIMAPMDAAKAAGFDLGVGADRVGAFLAAIKRVEHELGRTVTVADADAVAYWTNKLALTPDKSGTILASNGAAGLFLQFMNQQIKMQARAVGMFTGLPIEQGFTTAERFRMGAFQLGSYGLGGLKLGQLYHNAHPDHDLDPRVEDLMMQGGYGFLLNEAFRFAANPDKAMRGLKGERQGDRLNVAESISPVNFIGPQIESLTSLFDYHVSNAPLYSEHSEWAEKFGPWGNSVVDALKSSPGGGMVGNMWDIGRVAALAVGGDFPMPAPDKISAIAQEAARKWPVANNLLRAYIEHTTGIAVDGQGRPIVRVQENAALAAPFGIKTEAEDSVNAAYRSLVGSVGDRDAIINALQDEARGNAQLVSKLLIDEDRPWAERLKLMWQHSVLYKSDQQLVNPDDRQVYFTALVSAVKSNETLKEGRVIQKLVDNMGIGKVRLGVGEDAETAIKKLNLPAEDEQMVLNFVRQQTDLSHFATGE